MLEFFFVWQICQTHQDSDVVSSQSEKFKEEVLTKTDAVPKFYFNNSKKPKGKTVINEKE